MSRIHDALKKAEQRRRELLDSEIPGLNAGKARTTATGGPDRPDPAPAQAGRERREREAAAETERLQMLERGSAERLLSARVKLHEKAARQAWMRTGRGKLPNIWRHTALTAALLGAFGLGLLMPAGERGARDATPGGAPGDAAVSPAAMAKGSETTATATLQLKLERDLGRIGRQRR